MNKNAIIAAIWAACALFLLESHSAGQNQALSGTSLNVTGNASITGSTILSTLMVSGTVQGSLSVSGTADFLANCLLFGTVNSGTASGLEGVGMLFTDGTTSRLDLTSTSALQEWRWNHKTADLAAVVPMMKLDANNVLTLYKTSGTAGIILDPNGSGMMNGSNLLTQSAANALYLPSTSGLTLDNGHVGIGTTFPQAKLDVSGNVCFDQGNITTDGAGNLSAKTAAVNTVVTSRACGEGVGGNALVSQNGGSITWKDVNGNTNVYPYQPDSSRFGVFMERVSDYDSDNNPYQIDYLSIGGDWPATFAPLDVSVLLGNQPGRAFSVRYWGPGGWAYPLHADGASGNVGINTDTPQATLDVQGSVNVSGPAAFAGPIRVAPQGDLDMGQFAVDANPQISVPIQNMQRNWNRPNTSGTMNALTSGTLSIP